MTITLNLNNWLTSRNLLVQGEEVLAVADLEAWLTQGFEYETGFELSAVRDLTATVSRFHDELRVDYTFAPIDSEDCRECEGESLECAHIHEGHESFRVLELWQA